MSVRKKERSVLGVLFIPRPPQVPALVAVKDVRNVGLLDLGAGQVHPDAALVALDHWPPSKRFPAVAGDQVPRIVSCMWKKRYVRSPDQITNIVWKRNEWNLPDSTIMSSSAIQVSPSLELISASLMDSSCGIFPRVGTLADEVLCTASSSLIGRTSACPCRLSESVSLWAEVLSFLALGCLEFLLRLMRALFSLSLLPLSAADIAEPSDSFFSFLSFLRSAFVPAGLSYKESLRRILSSNVLSECMRRIPFPLFARAFRTNVWMVWMSELPSAQALPVELVPPPPPTSADNPELCAELDDVGDHELS